MLSKQKTAYEMSLCDWSSDVCSSDLKSSWLDRSIQFRKGTQTQNAKPHRNAFGQQNEREGHEGGAGGRMEKKGKVGKEGRMNQKSCGGGGCGREPSCAPIAVSQIPYYSPG